MLPDSNLKEISDVIWKETKKTSEKQKLLRGLCRS